MNKIEVYDSVKILAEEAAKDFGRIVNEILNYQPSFFCAISGGNTPKLFFKSLTGAPYKEQLEWNRIHFFWADERMVPPDSPDSNYGSAKKILFGHIPIPQKNIHRIKGEENPQKEVHRYAAEMTEHLSSDKKGFPRFNLIYLGIGEDGHTASLFPGKKLEPVDMKKICGLTEHPVKGHLRISLTKETINNSERIVFLVSGESKAAILPQIFNQRSKNLPAAQIKAVNGTIKWFIDKESASSISIK